MVGLVIVSHSASLAEGVVELARGMGGDEVAIEPAGGLDLPERPLGTDAALVAAAIERADAGDGVLVLMDLGSAVLSAEMALELLAPERRGRVLLCAAPLVEGAVAAAVSAKIGAPLAEVAAEARSGLEPKVTHLGSAEPEAGKAGLAGETLKLRLELTNPLGLHARPAARFVQTAAKFDAVVEVTNLTSGRGPGSARSLNALATLGARQGHELLVTARGTQAAGALAALQALAERSFDEGDDEPPPAPLRVPAPPEGSALGGLPAAPGIALGPARHLRRPIPAIPTHAAQDVGAEWKALRSALERVRREIQATRLAVTARAGERSAAIFDAHLLFLEDEQLLEPARRAILYEGRNAAHAWNTAAEATAAAYRSIEDEYLQARGEDLLGVSRRVVSELLDGGSERSLVGKPGILVADDLTPGETAGLDGDVVHGLATASGGPTSHSAILARALGIPAVVGVGEALLGVAEGAQLLLDGETGVVYVDPPPELVADYAERRRARDRRVELARTRAYEPAVTADGRRIEVAANVGSAEEVAGAVAAGAEGIGLLRTEFLFLDRDSMPDEDEQYEAYRRIAVALEGRPLILRTLDVGGDKPLPYLAQPAEANPFLGLRGIRLALAEPELLRTQLRAASRVASDHPLKIMFPMVATLGEYRQARALAGDLEVGVMLETPAAALMAEAFAAEVDFFSIGTNDLTQYTMAAERGNERVAALADALQPPVLRLIRRATQAAEAHGKWVGVCGELAGDARAAPLLIGLGVTELSAAVPAIPLVKQAVRGVNMADAVALAERALALEAASDVRALLEEAAGE